MAEGIRKRHTKSCPARAGGTCRCDGGYEASVYSPRDGKKLYKTFARKAEAKSWRADTKRSLDRGSLRAPGSRTIREAGEAWLEGAKRGEIRNRSGRPFKPSSLRGYEQSFVDRIVPAIGHVKVAALTTSDLQVLVDQWQAEGLAASTVRNSLRPLQAIYRRARAREGVPVNPTRDLELPVPDRREIEIVSPALAAKLLAALPASDRPVWAAALYAGLRSGELRALRWEAVNLTRRVIEVRESWDPKEGVIEPKTRRSRRKVPVPIVLRKQLVARQERNGSVADAALVFGDGNGTPFQPEKLYRDADDAWHKAGIRERLRLHQARHTYASFMIAAGVNAKALSSFMGHASITVTFDLYGHLMPGSEAEGAALLDAYLDGRSKDAEEDDE
jgi:integrase